MMVVLRLCFLIIVKALLLPFLVHGTLVLDRNSAMENWFPNNNVTSVGVVRSTSECGLHCSAVGWCVSIIYDSANHNCYLRDVSFTDISDGYWKPNSTHFKVKSPVPDGYDCNTFPGTCVNLLFSAYTWDDAFDACEAKGERLLLIDTALKQLEVEQFMQNQGLANVWVRLTDQVAEGVWLDGYGNVMGYNNFGIGQPDNSGGNQNCVAIHSIIVYLWDDAWCGQTYSVVCARI